MSRPFRSASAIEDNFWGHVAPVGECLIWTGHIRKDGYGALSIRRRPVMAHRYAYELRVGAIPPGAQLDHLCRNRACVNVSHLEAVTQAENILRGVGFSALNARKIQCPRGHAYDDANTIRLKSGGRWCAACHRENERGRYRKTTGSPGGMFRGPSGRFVKAVEVDPYARTGKVVAR